MFSARACVRLVTEERIGARTPFARHFEPTCEQTVTETSGPESRCLAFDLLLSGDEIERKTALKWVLRKAREGIE